MELARTWKQDFFIIIFYGNRWYCANFGAFKRTLSRLIIRHSFQIFSI